MTSVWRVSRNPLQLHPYNLQLLQALKPADYDLRANFLNKMMMHDDADFHDRIFFSDEKKFQINGTVNIHMSASRDMKVLTKWYSCK